MERGGLERLKLSAFESGGRREGVENDEEDKEEEEEEEEVPVITTLSPSNNPTQAFPPISPPGFCPSLEEGGVL